MKVKVKDIAKAAGVSPATASLVLNNKPSRIADSTKERIFRVARELQFQKEAEIDFEGFKEIKTIGVAIPDAMNMFYHKMGEEIAAFASASDYVVFQCYTGDDIDRFYAALEGLTAKNVDGIIAIPPRTMDKNNVKLLKSVQKSKVPLVLLDRAAYSVFCDFVTADNKHGGRIATEYLISRGHRKVGCMVDELNVYTAKKRLEGYKEALAAYKIPYDNDLVFCGNYDTKTGYIGAEALLKKGVTAIVTGSDLMAYGVYLYARDHGLRIPEDLSVIGYDNTELCRVIDVPLTSVDQNAEIMAHKAVEVLLRQIEGGEEEAPARNYYFTPYIVERESVKQVEG